MVQQTAMQTLFINLESIDIKVPQGIKDVYLQMEKEQIINAHGLKYYDLNEEVITGEQYYNETYDRAADTK